mmetsp:Transcript_13605/g.42587  ORF Transcript_13605/g.42587 Transcript_13605/m.42587 type:complete len:300 (+) Transcript_13605:762-1661(+)
MRQRHRSGDPAQGLGNVWALEGGLALADSTAEAARAEHGRVRERQAPHADTPGSLLQEELRTRLEEVLVVEPRAEVAHGGWSSLRQGRAHDPLEWLHDGTEQLVGLAREKRLADSLTFSHSAHGGECLLLQVGEQTELMHHVLALGRLVTVLESAHTRNQAHCLEQCEQGLGRCSVFAVGAGLLHYRDEYTHRHRDDRLLDMRCCASKSVMSNALAAPWPGRRAIPGREALRHRGCRSQWTSQNASGAEPCSAMPPGTSIQGSRPCESCMRQHDWWGNDWLCRHPAYKRPSKRSSAPHG